MDCYNIQFIWGDGGPTTILYPCKSAKEALRWAANNIPCRSQLWKVSITPTSYDGVVTLPEQTAKYPKPSRSLADALVDLGTRVGLFRKP